MEVHLLQKEDEILMCRWESSSSSLLMSVGVPPPSSLLVFANRSPVVFARPIPFCFCLLLAKVSPKGHKEGHYSNLSRGKSSSILSAVSHMLTRREKRRGVTGLVIIIGTQICSTTSRLLEQEQHYFKCGFVSSSNDGKRRR